MDWYRIKTVLIYLLLAVNLFLAAHLGVESLSKRRAERERAMAAVHVLQAAGITVSTEDIPTKAPRLGVLRVENPLADGMRFAEKILGGSPVKIDNTYRRDGRTVTVSGRSFVYESGLVKRAAEKKDIRRMRSVLEGMGFSMEYAKGELYGEAVRFTLRVDGVPLMGCVLTVWPSDETAARVEGSWLRVLENAAGKTAVQSAADALLAYLQAGKYAGSTVKSVACGYAVLLDENGFQTADAVPAWRIDTADGKTFYYEAAQGIVQ